MDRHYLRGEQDQPRVDPDQQAGDDRVGQGPGDDPVDFVQPVLQDRDADGGGQGKGREERDDVQGEYDRVGAEAEPEDPGQPENGYHAPAQQPFQLLSALPARLPGL